MQPRQKLRWISAAGLGTGLAVLFYLLVAERPPNQIHVQLVVAYLFAILLGGMIYMLRHREEFRDPPDVREQQQQWAIKNGPALLNLIIVLFAAEAIWLAFRLQSGHLDQRRAMLLRVNLIASLPALLLSIWIKVRIRKGRQRGNKDSG
jgi:hypothetical protein